MTSPAEYLGLDDSLVVAAQALKTSNVGSMPVVTDDGALAGVLTDRDIVIRGVAEGGDPSLTTVGDICTGSVVSVSADDDAVTVTQVLAENQIRRVPVLDGDRLVGIVSQADIARNLSADRTGDVVSAISQP